MITFLLQNFHIIENIFAVTGLTAWLSAFFNPQPKNKALSLVVKIINFAAANILKAKNKQS